MILGQLQNKTPHINQRAKQDEFWKLIIERYKEEIMVLEDEKNIRTESINDLEVALLPYISFKIAQLSDEDLYTNVNHILGLEQQSCYDASGEEETVSGDKENIPDLSDISVFSIDEADVHYMDIITEYTADEDKLRKDIKKLKQQYMALKDERIEVKELLCAKGNKKFEVDADLMRSTNSKLIEQNESLKKELESLKHTKTSKSSIDVSSEIENYRKIISTTQEKLDKYKDRTWHSESLQSCRNMASKIQSINVQVEEQRTVNEQLKEQICKLSSNVIQLQNQLVLKKLHEYEKM